MTFHFHTFDFPEYSVSGIDNTPSKLKVIQMPETLHGKSVLDIGAWDGYFSFVAEKRGAKKVLAIDSSKWNWNSEGIIVAGKRVEQNGKQVFDEVRKILNSKIEDKDMEIIDIDKLEQFDLVLCLGILYHMKDPWTIIEKLGKITKEQLIIETHSDGNYLSVPAMIFYPEKEVNNDENTYWGPNFSCLYFMLKKAGFKQIKLINSYGTRLIVHAFK